MSISGGRTSRKRVSGELFYGTSSWRTLIFRGRASGRRDWAQVDFRGADLRSAEFFGADLRDAIHLTPGQIGAAFGDENTQLPDGLTRPAGWIAASPHPRQQSLRGLGWWRIERMLSCNRYRPALRWREKSWHRVFDRGGRSVARSVAAMATVHLTRDAGRDEGVRSRRG